jgi:hypothetical protein
MIPIRKEILWDLDPLKLDPDKNKALIIERVLSYGTLSELIFLFSYYDLKTIRQTVKNTGYFDPKTFEFITTYLNIYKEEMKCYIKKQSAIQHWS